MKRSGRNSALSLAGPLTLVLIVALSAIIVFYQFVYLPSAGGSEQISEEFLSPPGSIQVLIVEGSINIDQEENFVPREPTVTLGVDNSVVWLSQDPILHTVTADPGSPDDFGEGASRSNWLDLGDTFTFVFTSPGEFKYHCEPHPWMRGTIIVVGPAAE
ncbi:MAG: plastocyanin/azurin family copper-binding protein [Nitrososphaerales archaeon]